MPWTEFRIIHGVPMPPAHVKLRKYPWWDLQVSDGSPMDSGFFVPLTHATQNAISSGCVRMGKQLGRKFCTRRMTLEGIDGTFCWRSK